MSFIIDQIMTIVSKKKANKLPVLIFNYSGDVEMYVFDKRQGNTIVAKNINGYNGSRTFYLEDLANISGVKWINKDFAKKIQKVTEDKSPTTKDNHVGIELEFISTLDSHTIQMALVEAGIEDYVHLKDDGSIDTEGKYEYSHELCILATEKKFPSVVKKVCKILHKNSTVNKSCGMHVHIDMRNRDRELAYKNLFSAQPLLYSMVPKSRRNGSYSMFVDEYFSCGDDCGDRYVGINKQSYSKHKTLECRIHSGSLNADKIINWVLLLVKISNGKSDKAELLTDLASFKKQYRVRGKLDKYIKERLKNFERDHGSWENKVSA